MPKRAETAAITSMLLQQYTMHLSQPKSSPNPRVVYVGGEQQLVVLVPRHASDLVWRSLNDERLSVHLVEVVQAQLLLITCMPQLGLYHSYVSELRMSCAAGEQSLSLRLVCHSVHMSAYVEHMKSWPHILASALTHCRAARRSRQAITLLPPSRSSIWQQQCHQTSGVARPPPSDSMSPDMS